MVLKPVNKTSQSLTTVIVFVVVIMGILFAYTMLPKRGTNSKGASQFKSMVNAFRVGYMFTDGQKDSVRSSFAGYFSYSSDTSMDSATAARPYFCRDRIEIKPNGIIWRIRWQQVRLPRGELRSFYTVVQGFCMPFGKPSATDPLALCEIRVIAKVLAMTGDTCYVNVNGEREVTWKMITNKAGLMIDKGQFVPYDTVGLITFFPRGMVRLCENPAIKQCRAETKFMSIAKTWIIDEFARTTCQQLSADTIGSIVRGLYDPVVIGSMAEEWSVASPCKLAVSFTVAPSGVVTQVRRLTSSTGNGEFDKEIATEVGGWLFPRALAGKSPVDVAYTFNF